MKRRRPDPLPTLQTGKIYKLPVRVFYNLPDSHYSYTTTLPTSQDVFIHRQPRVKVGSSNNLNGRAGEAGKKRKVGGSDAVSQNTEGTISGDQDDDMDEDDDEDHGDEDEEGEVYMGSVSLRAIVRAICRASPEIIPSTSTPDCSLYLPVLTHPDQPKAPRRTMSRFPSLEMQMTPDNGNNVQGSSPATNASIQTPREHQSQHHHHHSHYQRHRRQSQIQSQHPGHLINAPAPQALGGTASYPSPAYSNASLSLGPVLPPQEGKGLLSWIYNESAPGKTLGKGYVRLNPLSVGPGGRGIEDEDADSEDDGMDGETENGEEDDGVDGLEGLVRAAERRAKREAARRERGKDMSPSRMGSERASKARPRTFGLELNVLLKSVPAGLGSNGTGSSTVEDEVDVKPTGLEGMKTSMDILGARAASQGRISTSGIDRDQVLSVPQASGSNSNKGRPGLGGERAASSPGLLAAMSGTHLSSTAGARPRRISGLPVSKSLVPGLGGRAAMGPSASQAAIEATSSTTTTTTIDLKGSKPKVVQGGPGAGNDETPPRPPVVPGTSSGATLIADILRTPRQGSKKTGGGGGNNIDTDRPPQSSPATHMALARQVLRNPTSHTIDLAQKLVGKDAFAQILIEMGVQAQAGGESEPIAGPSRQPQAAKPQGTSEVAIGSAVTRTRSKAGPASMGPNKGKGKASVVAPGPIATGVTGPSVSAASLSKTAPPVIAVKPVCKNCGTTETPRWRVKTLADGKERRVCDACGIYFNKTKQMRPKELWSPNAKRIPLEDIPKQEAAMAASRAAAAKQMATLGKASTPTVGSSSKITQAPNRPASAQPSQPTRQPAVVPEVPHRANEVSFADLPASPPRQPRTLSESVFTTPRRSTRLSQGGSSKNPRADQDEAGASPKLRRTPRRMAATAAASKVKATFEGHTGIGARHHKLGSHLKDEPYDEQKPDAATRPIQTSHGVHSPSRDRSLTPPPVSEAASRHNDPGAWQMQADDMLGMQHDSNDLFERFTALGNGALDNATSDTDQLDYDLSTWIDMAPLDAEVEAGVSATLPEPVVDNQDVKFTLDEMNLLLHLTQNQEIMGFPDQTENGIANMQVPDWDPSSPWSLPTPSGGSLTVPKNWLEDGLAAEFVGDVAQTS